MFDIYYYNINDLSENMTFTPVNVLLILGDLE